MKAHDSIALILYRARVHSKLTQANVAEAVNVHTTSIYHYETGRNIPPCSMLKKLCKLYNLNYTNLEQLVTTELLSRWRRT